MEDWLGGEIIEDFDGDGTDGDAVQQGKISITPLHLDLTGYAFADTLRTWTLSP